MNEAKMHFKRAYVVVCGMDDDDDSLGKALDSVTGSSLAGYRCVVTLGRLFTPMCLCH